MEKWHKQTPLRSEPCYIKRVMKEVMNQPEELKKAVALFVNKDELEDIQMSLLALQGKWIVQADMSESDEYLMALDSSLEKLDKLLWKVKTVIDEAF